MSSGRRDHNKATGLGIHLILNVPLPIAHFFLLWSLKQRRTLFPQREREREDRRDFKLHEK